MIRFCARVAAYLILLAAVGSPAWAGKGAFLPTFHPKPCSGDDCQGDDPRSTLPCKGFLCSLNSARAMQTPVTAAEAAEAERARAAAIAAAAAAAPPPVAVPVNAKRKRNAKAKPKTIVQTDAPDAVPGADPAPAK